MKKNLIKIIAAVLLAGMLPVMAAAQQITKPADRSSTEIGKQVDISFTGSNIEVTWIVLERDPNPKSENEPRKAMGTISKSPYSIPADSIKNYEDKWLKIAARDTKSGKWSSPVYVKITKAKPVVQLKDRSEIPIGKWDKTVYVSGSSSTLYFIGLNGSPNPNLSPSNPLNGESNFIKVKAHFTGGNTEKTQFSFPNLIASDWQNKWVKVIAQQGNIWSAPVYIRLTPPPVVADKVSGRGIVVTTRTEVPNEGGVLVKKNANGSTTCNIFLPQKAAAALYVTFTKPTAADAIEAIATEAAGFIPVVGDFISAAALVKQLVRDEEVSRFGNAYLEVNKNANSFARITKTSNSPGHNYACVTTRPLYLQAGDGDFYKMSELKDSELSEYFFYGMRFKR